MMDRVEEVKKILDKRYSRYTEFLAHQEGTAEEICRLFGPRLVPKGWQARMRNK